MYNIEVYAITDSDGVILKRYETSQGIEAVKVACKKKNISGDIRAVSKTFEGHRGQNIREFTSEGARRPLEELAQEGFIKLQTQEQEENGIKVGTVLEKILDNRIVQKTPYELVKEGSKELEETEYVDEETQEIKIGDPKKLFDIGKIAKEKYLEHLAMEIRNKRDSILKLEVDPIVMNPLRWGELNEEKQNALSSYRKELLDITKQESFPESVTWPEIK